MTTPERRTGDAAESFQNRVQPWMMACFGPEISGDRVERGDRLLEEVLELLQSGGYDPARVMALRDYVWGREKGDPAQEVGGVQVTLAAYCLAHELDMHEAGETELARIWTKVEKIRAKQAAKPVGSALPVGTPSDTAPSPKGPAPVVGEDEPPKPDRFAYWNSLPESEKQKIRGDWHRDMFGDEDGDEEIAAILADTSPVTEEDKPLIEAFDRATAAAKARIASPQEAQAVSEAPSPKGVSDGVRDVLAERRRQIEAEGWTPEHDDTHARGQMLTAAWCYMQRHADKDMFGDHYDINALPAPARWPWDLMWWKPTNRRRDLVKAGALILAEIDRLDRRQIREDSANG